MAGSGAVWFVLAILLVALTFDFINGFHDAANSIATVVSTRVLSPSAAVVWAAFWNFVAAFVFGTAIAKTVGKGLIDLSVVDSTVVLGGLLGAITWDLVTWWLGLPTSSSHALIGGYAGAAVAKAGFAAIIASGWTKTLIFIVVAPVMGFALALLLTVALSWILRRSLPRRVDKTFRVLQLVSAAAYSLGHGTNDAQKTMGQRITKLTPFGGFCAETAGAITLFVSSHYGIPVSTTHTITGAITGVGSAQRFSAVRWGVAGRIVWAWVATIPAAAGIGGLTYLLLRAVV